MIVFEYGQICSSFAGSGLITSRTLFSFKHLYRKTIPDLKLHILQRSQLAKSLLMINNRWRRLVLHIRDLARFPQRVNGTPRRRLLLVEARLVVLHDHVLSGPLLHVARYWNLLHPLKLQMAIAQSHFTWLVVLIFLYGRLQWSY